MDAVKGAAAGAGAKATGAMDGMKAKASSAMDDLDDHLPPSLRTAKQIAKKLGTNKAARAACMTLASGERLTAVQKKALFKMGIREKVDERAMLAMIKQADGLGVTPMELDLMKAEGLKKQMSKQLLNGFGWMAGENAGPGTMSVILEAQARLCGIASAVDSDEAEVSSVRVLRQMVFGHSIRPMDMADYLCTVFGTLDGTESNNNTAEKFWLRFAQDALAVPNSKESIMLQQLLLGRGIGPWSASKVPVEDQGEVLIKLITRIERGAPKVKKPPPSKDDIAAGGALMAEAYADCDIDEDETRLIFQDYDTDHGGSLDMDELTKVIIAIIKRVRKSAVEKSEAHPEQDTTDKQSIEDRFKNMLQHYDSPSGRAELADTFDPSGDGDVSQDEFVSAFPKFVRSFSGAPDPDPEPAPAPEAAPEPEPEPDPEPDPDPDPEPDIESGTMVAAAGGAELTKEEKKAAKAAEKQAAKEAKAQEKVDKKNAKEKAKFDKQQEKTRLKTEKRKKKAADKARKKRAKSGAGADHLDSDDEENFTGAKMPAPRGAKEMFAYLASNGSAAPRGIATILYIGVNERLPHSIVMSLVYLVIGADLGPRDVSNLLALITLEKKSVQHASDQYFKLCEPAWKEKEEATEKICENFSRQLSEYQASGKEEPLVFELGVSEKVIEEFLQEKCEEMCMDIESVSGAWDKKAGAEIRRGWTVTVTQGQGPPPETQAEPEIEAPAADGPTTEGAEEALAEPAVDGEEDLALADRVQGGEDDDNQEEAVEPTAEEAVDPTAEAEEVEEAVEADAAPAEESDAEKGEIGLTPEQQEDIDAAYRTVPGRKDGRLANTLFRLARTANRITVHEASDLYIRAREVLKPELLGNGGLEGLLDGHWPKETLDLFDKGASSPRAGSPKAREMEFENPVSDGGTDEMGQSMDLAALDQESEDAGTFEVDPNPEAGALSPQALRQYAKEYEPDFVPTQYASLVAVLLSQATNNYTLKAFQTLIMRQAMPPEEVEAMTAVAAKQGVDFDDMNALIWLWTGGARPAMAIPMTEPVNSETPTPISPPADAKGKLELTVIRANGLMKADRFSNSDPFCTVRVEGHQRNTETIKKNLDPEWNVTMGFRVTDRSTAVVEVYIFDENKNGTSDPLGRVSFPLSILEQDVTWNDPDTPLEVEFEIEPMRVMTQKHGELGTLTLALNFHASDAQPVIPNVTSHRIEKLICTLQDHRVNADVIQYIREAAAIVLTRTRKNLQTPRPPKPTLRELQEQAEKEVAAKGPEEAMYVKADLEYDADADKANERAASNPIRQKYMTAIAYCLGKFLGINPAVLGVVAGTIIKFAPAPEVTGSYAAATLGVLGLPERALAGIKKFLADRLSEEMEKLVRAARLDNQYFKELQKMCRGQGCAQAMVDRASSIVAQADSFSTAAALFRLKAGQGAAEPEECTALEEVVAKSPDDFVTAGVQNLQLLIWPVREETFDIVRELMDGNKAAEQGLSGWENRAELALILKSDDLAMRALKGLVHMEEFRVYLDTKKKDLEKIALAKLLAGDKAACAVMRKLTPSFGEKVNREWDNLNRFQKVKVSAFVGTLALVGLSQSIKAIGLTGALGETVQLVVDTLIFIATMIIGIIAGVWFVLQGKPYRDKVVGPNKSGVDLLRKLSSTAEEADAKKQAMEALQMMLMGQEPNVEGTAFLRSKAAKYMEKAPEAMEALNTLEYIFVLQQAGKSTALIHQYDEKVEWPKPSELWPPSKYKLQEAASALKKKGKSFVFSASVNPWIKKYAQHAGNCLELFQAVEVPLSMIKNIEEEYDALEKIYKGNRVDTVGLKPLSDIVDKLVNLDKHGADPTTLRDALAKNFRGVNAKDIFEELDSDASGTLDKEECNAAAGILSEKLGFTISSEDMDEAFAQMDMDGDGEIELKEFQGWWKGYAMNKKQKKALQMQQMEAAGLLEASPKPKELQLTLKVITKLMPTMGLRLRAFEVLEDMCPDDATFDVLQEAYNLCELKRAMINDPGARNAIIGLEAMCMVPLLLKGDPKIGIDPNPKAAEILEKVKKGDKAAIGALAYLKQPERRRYWGMMTQRQRRLFILTCGIASYPALYYSGALSDFPTDALIGALAAGFVDCDDPKHANVTECMESSMSGSWNDEMGDESWVQDGPGAVPGADFAPDSPDPDAPRNPSFFVLGLLPLLSSLFVNLFGQRIASLITLATVFFASAGSIIASALAGEGGFTPAKLVGVSMGVYSGSVATKVATGNIKFAYGVQGASVGAILSRFSTFIWRPRVMWLIPELTPYMGWVDLTVAGGFGAAAAWVSNQYRGIISIFATAAIGAFGFIQVAVGYGIPGIENFTMGRLMAGGVSCGGEDTSCWAAGGLVLTLLVGGTMNQFKMETIDFNMPAVTAYERWIHKIEKGMTLLFALNEFIEGGVNLSTDDLMERCLKARDDLVQYMNLMTNLMHFGLCFGFIMDFIYNLEMGMYSAVPWAGAFSLGLAIVTPFQGTIGTLSDLFTSKKFALRMKEVKVPGFIRKFFPKIFPIGRESFIIKFGPIGQRLQKLSFYFAMVNGFISATMVAISWLTASMYAIHVKANWATLQHEMPGMDMDMAMKRVTMSISSIGDSAAGLFVILSSGISTAAFNLGGLNWLIVHGESV